MQPSPWESPSGGEAKELADYTVFAVEIAILVKNEVRNNH